MLKNAVVIDMVSVQNLLVPFCCFLGKDTLRHFLQLGGPEQAVPNFSHTFSKTKKLNKNFDRTATSWQLRKQVGVIAWQLLCI